MSHYLLLALLAAFLAWKESRCNRSPDAAPQQLPPPNPRSDTELRTFPRPDRPLANGPVRLPPRTHDEEAVRRDSDDTIADAELGNPFVDPVQRRVFV